MVIISGLTLEHVRDLAASTTARCDAEESFRQACRLLYRHGKDHTVVFEGMLFQVTLFTETYAEYRQIGVAA